ncbi:MAG: hypothetical protein NVS3B28_00210 [Candidatus Velthaea sp.]
MPATDHVQPTGSARTLLHPNRRLTDVAISGRSSSGTERSCGVMPIAPPVEKCTMGSLLAVGAAMHVNHRRPCRTNLRRDLVELRRSYGEMRRLAGCEFRPRRVRP